MNFIFKKESLTYIGLIIITLIFLFYTSDQVQLFFFLSMLVLFYRSKRDYFWLAYFAVVLFETGGFFARDMILGFGSVPLSLVFMVSATFSIKALRKKNQPVFLFRKQYRLWAIYMIFLLLVGILVFGLGEMGKSGLRYYFFVTTFVATTPVLFAIPRYFKDYNFLVKFSRLIFIAVFINLVGQIIHIALGNPVFLILKPELTLLGEGLKDIEFGSQLIRPVWGHWICFLGLFLALYFQIRNESAFKKSLLILVVFTSFISIFIGATRGWFLAFSFIIAALPVVFSSKKNLGTILKFAIASITLAILLYSISSSFRVQANFVFDRLSTLELLLEGDATAGGTNTRLTSRSANVMKVYRESPVFGKGLSSSALDTSDTHVGNQNMLMEGGVVGFAINIIVWASVILLTLRLHFRSYKNPYYKRELLVVVISFLGLFIIHSSSSAIFGYLILIKHPDKFIFISIVFGIVNCILTENKREIFMAPGIQNKPNS